MCSIDVINFIFFISISIVRETGCNLLLGILAGTIAITSSLITPEIRKRKFLHRDKYV